MSYEFCSKIFENRLRFDKVTESLKVGTFLRHSVDLHDIWQVPVMYSLQLSLFNKSHILLFEAKHRKGTERYF